MMHLLNENRDDITRSSAKTFLELTKDDESCFEGRNTELKTNFRQLFHEVD